MHFELSHMLSASPEMFLLGMACVILVVDLFLKQEQRLVSYILTQISLVGTLALTLWFATPQAEILFDGNYVRDPMSDVLKVAICITALFAFVYAKDYLIHRDLFHGEYFVLGLVAVLGMMVIVSAGTFLTVYLGLELLALSMYALVAFDRDSPKGSEAAMKYFVLGALASGLLLYGISMIYGATGSIDLREVSQAVATGKMNDMVLVFGLVFVVIGVSFKFGAVPFHMWVPDVYDGAPTAVTLFVGSIPKIAAFALAMRILVDGLGGLHADWQGMLIILSVLSVAIGNVVAIAQTNIKRMFAYSTISHVGFILMGILAGSQAGYAAAMFYSIVYALMALGGFGMLILLSRKGFEAENLEDLKGLNERSPWYAGMMLLLMFSMAGVPPLVGFFAKLFVLDAVVRAGFVWLAVVGVLFSLVGAFYYLRVIKLMYFDKPAEDAQPLAASMDTQVAMSVNGLAVLLLGLYPTGLLALCLAAVK